MEDLRFKEKGGMNDEENNLFGVDSSAVLGDGFCCIGRTVFVALRHDV